MMFLSGKILLPSPSPDLIANAVLAFRSRLALLLAQLREASFGAVTANSKSHPCFCALFVILPRAFFYSLLPKGVIPCGLHRGSPLRPRGSLSSSSLTCSDLR